MTPDEILAALQRNVRRLDNWRGYIGDDEDSPTDDEVHEVLQQARLELAGPRGGARIAEQLYLRVAELERQRDAALALHRSVETPAIHRAPAKVQCDRCRSLCHSGSGLHCDEPYDAPWPCDTVKIYGGGE